MATVSSREKAAQAWCKPRTSHKVMDPDLAEAFAEVLDEIWSQPWLGNATTKELRAELASRDSCPISRQDDYKTFDPEHPV